MVDSLLDGVIEKSAYLTKKDELIRRKVELEQKKADFEQKRNNWIEPLKQFVREAHNAEKLAVSNDFDEIKTFVRKIGTNHHLTNKNASLTFGACWRIVAKRAENSIWLGWRDSNPRMAGPEPAALPLGDIPTANIIVL